jgi:signal transduction histidine kinase
MIEGRDLIRVYICFCMSLTLLIGSSAFADSIDLTTEERAWLSSQDEITVAVSHGWAPVEFLDDEHRFSGISLDYIELLEQKLPINFKLVQSVEDPKKEQAQMLSAVGNPKLLTGSSYLAITKPYLKMPFVIFVRKDNQKIKSMDDLSGYKVAVFKSGAAARALEKHHPEVQLVRVDIADEALQALIEGKVDAYIGNLAVITYVAKNLGIGDLKIVDETPYGSEIHMAVKDDAPLLHSIIAKGLKAITPAERNEISRRWITVTYEHQTDYRLMITIIAVSLLIISLVSLWSWQLHREIKQRKQVEAELREARDMSETANRAKSAFLASMSHELRTPLNAIIGFSQLLELDKNLNVDQRSSIKEIHHAGEHLLDLINELLDLSSIEAGKLTLNIQAINVAECVNEVIEMVSMLAKPKQIQIKTELDSSLYIQADPFRLKQVLLNLLSNAIKYNCEAGQITIINQQVDNTYVELSIADTGEGISEEFLEEIFQPFHRLESHNNVEGAGIGLSITRHIIDLMNGRIYVESELGKGSLFRVWLPLAES